MQKVKCYYKPDDNDLNSIDKELQNGWIIKTMTGVGDKLIVLYEKINRKEKLQALNDLQQ